jgi:hypothetical protein
MARDAFPTDIMNQRKPSDNECDKQQHRQKAAHRSSMEPTDALVA